MPYKDVEKRRESCRESSRRARARGYNTKLNRARKAKLVALFGGACVDCGFNGHQAALDFDHRVPSEKKFNIGPKLRNAWADVVAEAEKCDLVCANCHRIRTVIRGGGL